MIGGTRAAAVGVDVDVDSRGVGPGVQSANRELGKLGGAAKLAGAAVVAGLAVATAAAAKFSFDAIGAASDWRETLNKSRVIFGDHGREMRKWAEGAAESAGLSKQAALEASSGFGDMFSQLGFAQGTAADMSRDVVQLAADLGSFNNLETSDVADRMSAAFRGEYDSLQALIPNINAARVEKEALASSGKKTADELTAQEKAAAVLAIMHKDGAKAAGDFARTQDGLANQSKILKADLENLKTELGEKLLPIATEFVGWLREEAIPWVKRTAEAFWDEFGPSIKDAGRAIRDDVIPALQAFYGWLRDEIVPVIKREVRPALKDIKDAFQELKEKIKENEPELRDLAEQLKKAGEWAAEHLIPVLVDLWKNHLVKMIEQIGAAIEVISTLVQWFKDAKAAVEDLIGWIGKIDWPDKPDWLDFSAPGFGPAPGAGGWGGLAEGSWVGDVEAFLASAASWGGPTVVDQRTYLRVDVDGSGIVDEHAVAQQLEGVLTRYADRLGRPLVIEGV